MIANRRRIIMGRSSGQARMLKEIYNQYHLYCFGSFGDLADLDDLRGWFSALHDW
jgi:hypothetical protein